TLTAATAQPDRTPLTGLQRVRQVHHQPGTGGADRVTEGDRAAIRVHPLSVHAELADRGQHHSGERLVDLYVRQVRRGPAGPAERLVDRRSRLVVQAVVRAGH